MRFLVAVAVAVCGPCFRVGAALTAATAPRGTARPSVRARACVPLLKASPPNEEASLATKGVWYATEVFGKAAKLVRGAPPVEEYAVGPPPASTAEAIARLVVDYEGTDDDPRPYFLTGKMDVALYDVDCEFADPFVSFRGRQRFKENLENLAGGFITDSSVRTLDTSSTDTSYTTRLLVKLQLGLPWKPVLAWPWGVEHVFDEQSGLIVQHIERWEVCPAEPNPNPNPNPDPNPNPNRTLTLTLTRDAADYAYYDNCSQLMTALAVAIQ